MRVTLDGFTITNTSSDVWTCELELGVGTSVQAWARIEPNQSRHVRYSEFSGTPQRIERLRYSKFAELFLRLGSTRSVGELAGDPVIRQSPWWERRVLQSLV